MAPSLSYAPVRGLAQSAGMDFFGPSTVRLHNGRGERRLFCLASQGLRSITRRDFHLDIIRVAHIHRAFFARAMERVGQVPYIQVG